MAPANGCRQRGEVMAQVGDRVQVPSKKVGQQPREGIVTGVSGTLLRIMWSTGEESTMTPSVGSLVVVGRVRASKVATTKQSGKARTGTGKTAKATSKKPNKGSTAKGAKPVKAARSPSSGSSKRRK
jgi:hypothetical protein